MTSLEKAKPLSKSLPSAQKKKEQAEGTKENAGKKTKTKQDLIRKTTTITTAATKTITTMPITIITRKTTELTESQDLSAHSVKSVAKRNTPQRNVTLKIMQQTDHHSAREDGQDRVRSTNMTSKTMNCLDNKPSL